MLCAAVCLSLFVPKQTPSEPNLEGQWVARRNTGPVLRGTLRLVPGRDHWEAQIGGRTADFTPTDSDIRFELPGGSFRGHMVGNKIEGHWMQSGGLMFGWSLASPVTLTKQAGAWSGDIKPLEDTFTMFLVVKKAEDGTLKAHYRNPERNLGTLERLDHLEVKGNDVTAIGTWGGSKQMKPLGIGKYDPENNVLSLYDPAGGFTHDFSTITNEL
ncbi:MAG: hypothetical protein QOJ65_2593, partial [Fimbriimonadaceae bacterium]|nr:hypothetical protein [Fimbriimonadaceae bacterium]